MELTIKELKKNFEGLTLFKDFSIEFHESTISCILGPSGCGKTTLLNMIAGIISPDSAIIKGFEGRIFSYIFQESRLLPWKTVRCNIEFVLDDSLTKQQKREEAERLIRQVDLEKFADYYPAQLSGGMRQRVSIARAFACHSDIILMDEPLSGLDITLKQSMIKWFSQIWRGDRRTVIFVTHDVDEALLLGNEIFVFSKPPVKIVSKVKIETPLENRDLDNPHLKEMKQQLIKAIGNHN